MVRRYWIRVASVAVAFVGAVFVSPSFAADAIQMGAILPLTGPGGVIGTQEQRGIQFAIDQVNAKGGVAGNQIEVQFEDNQAKPDQSVLSLQQADRSAARAGDLHRLFRSDARHGAAGDAQEGAAGECRRAGRQAGERPRPI